jgi:hypothetical protein
LKNTTSTSSSLVNSSTSFRIPGIESRFARSRVTVETLAFGVALRTEGASESCRRWVLRARRMMCVMPLEANWIAVLLPMPGPAPKTRMVRGRDIVMVWSVEVESVRMGMMEISSQTRVDEMWVLRVVNFQSVDMLGFIYIFIVRGCHQVCRIVRASSLPDCFPSVS